MSYIPSGHFISSMLKSLTDLTRNVLLNYANCYVKMIIGSLNSGASAENRRSFADESGDRKSVV